MTRMQLRCSPDQKKRWERAAGGAGSLSAWIRDVLDREAAAVVEGPDGKALGETPDEATTQVAPEGSSLTVDGTIVVDGPARIDLGGSTARKASVEEEPVGTNGDAEPDPPLPGEPDGSSSTAYNGRSPSTVGEERGVIRAAEVPAPIQAASLDIVVQRLFPGVKTEDLMAEYESTEHDFSDFLSWLPWRHEQDVINDVDTFFEPVKLTDAQREAAARPEKPSVFEASTVDEEEVARIVDEAVYGFSVTKNGERIDPASIEAYDPDDDTNPEPEDPVDLEPPRMLEAEQQHQRPTLSPVCVNAAMHWKLVAGETCRYCGGTL